MSERKPKRIGRYRILSELGRGAMGVVYRAEDPALQRVVALKTILITEDSDGGDEYRKRFILEARAAGKLTHPHIVTIFDFGEEGALAYMAMELLEGMELRERLKEGRLPTVEAVDVARQIADGLGFAHEHGVVHRDIKPGNIMLLDRGQAKIMDFGIARMRSADHKTSTGFVLGTPRFMSPEQISGAPVDQRSDIFSLGVVLYEMLTGEPLFAAEDPALIAHKVAHFEPAAPSKANREVTSLLDFAIARALKKDPDLRYQSAYELASDLRTCFAELLARAPARGEAGEATRTVKLESSEAKPPAAESIAPDTGLPLARRFDSATALRRLSTPGRRDRAQLPRAPARVGIVRRLWNDSGPRLLFSAVVLAGAAAVYIAVG